MKSVFISYSHKDESIREELAIHMSSLIRSNLITTWSDKKITPGEDWEQEIVHNIETADIILLLVTANFISSDYCYDKEVKYAVKRAKAKEAILIPIIAKKCMWSETPFAKFQALPTGGKPINLWDDIDEAYTDIVVGLKNVINEDLTNSQDISGTAEINNSDTQEMSTVSNQRNTVLETIKNISEIAKNVSGNKKLNDHIPENIFGKWRLVQIKQDNHNLSVPMLEIVMFYPNMTFQVFQNGMQTNYGQFNFNKDNLNLILFNGMNDKRHFYCKENQLIVHQKANNLDAFYQRTN